VTNHGFYFYTEEPDFDNEDLEEIQKLLWRGYVPERYPRHDWYVYPPITGFYHPPLKSMRKGWSEIKRKAPPKTKRRVVPKRKPRRIVPQYSLFRCDSCKREFRSVIAEAEADAAYRETFGPKAPDERLAVCEECYDRMMKELRGL
jgi:hypothetical protein